MRLQELNLKRVSVICGLLISCSALIAAGSDVSGLWTGTIDILDQSSGTTISTPVRIELDQQPTAISGKIGRPEDPEVTPIRNVHREGNKIWFEAVSGETAGPVQFALTMEGDSMEGDMKTALDTETINGKVKVTRSKR